MVQIRGKTPAPPVAETPKAPAAPPVAETPKTALALSRPADLPAFIEVAPEGQLAAGLENVRDEGLQLPLLQIAQPMTPEVVQGKLAGGDVFLQSDKEHALFGKDTEVNFVAFFHFKEWIKWQHRDAGGGIMARSKDPKGPLAMQHQVEWQTGRKPAKEGEKLPRIIEYSTLFLVFEGDTDPVAFPLSRSKMKAGRQLISFALKRGAGVPLFGGKYSMKTALETNKKNQSYFVPIFQPAGFPTKDEYDLCKKSYEFCREQFDKLQLAYADDRDESPEETVSTEV